MESARSCLTRPTHPVQKRTGWLEKWPPDGFRSRARQRNHRRLCPKRPSASDGEEPIVGAKVPERLRPPKARRDKKHIVVDSAGLGRNTCQNTKELPRGFRGSTALFREASQLAISSCSSAESEPERRSFHPSSPTTGQRNSTSPLCTRRSRRMLRA